MPERRRKKRLHGGGLVPCSLAEEETRFVWRRRTRGSASFVAGSCFRSWCPVALAHLTADVAFAATDATRSAVAREVVEQRSCHRRTWRVRIVPSGGGRVRKWSANPCAGLVFRFSFDSPYQIT